MKKNDEFTTGIKIITQYRCRGNNFEKEKRRIPYPADFFLIHPATR